MCSNEDAEVEAVMRSNEVLSVPLQAIVAVSAYMTYATMVRRPGERGMPIRQMVRNMRRDTLRGGVRVLDVLPSVPLRSILGIVQSLLHNHRPLSFEPLLGECHVREQGAIISERGVTNSSTGAPAVGGPKPKGPSHLALKPTWSADAKVYI